MMFPLLFDNTAVVYFQNWYIYIYLKMRIFSYVTGPFNLGRIQTSRMSDSILSGSTYRMFK